MRVLLPLLFLCASSASAQSPAEAHYLSATQIRDAVAGAGQAAAHMAAKPLGDMGAYTYLAVRRDQTGEVEVHATLDDAIVVQEGAATVLYGGQLAGERETAPGERRGGQITGGTTRSVAAGDLLIIPAGMPHQVRVEPGASVTYIVVKVARAPGSKAPGR